MEVSFDVDINLDDDNSHSNDDCELHNDYDNQKLFDIYESYLNKSDISDTESEPEISFSDQFYQLVTNKCSKTPLINRTNRCLADIECRTPRVSKTPIKNIMSNDCNQSVEESMTELKLPWNLNHMSDQQIIDLGNQLEEDLFLMENDVPKTAANQIKDICDKQMKLLVQMSDKSEEKFDYCLKKINSKSEDKRLDYNLLIGEQLAINKSNSEELTKLEFQLNLIKQISNK